MSLKILIDIERQSLALLRDGSLERDYLVSTAALGAGEQNGSYQTPRGLHLVRAKIGNGMPENAVFVGRRWTGEIWTPELHARYPGRDWILTRILWLSGCQPGFNRLGGVDTMRRYVYIHGTPDITELGHPGSHGCIRMGNADMIELFERVPAYTPVEIVEAS
jgi:L,D-transpeptidase YbiS